jgi:hypothetical protein
MKKVILGCLIIFSLVGPVMADPYHEDSLELAKHKFQKEQVMYQAS